MTHGSGSYDSHVYIDECSLVFMFTCPEHHYVHTWNPNGARCFDLEKALFWRAQG